MTDSIGKDIADGVDASLKDQLSDMPNMRRSGDHLKARVIAGSAVRAAVFVALSGPIDTFQDHADSALD
jgi:hypothetical protein